MDPCLTGLIVSLTGRTHRVIVNGERSQFSEVSSGVPQGSVLGPLLFLCCINDITSSVTSSIKLYADDILIYRVVNTEDDCKMLQRDLDTLQCWTHKWTMFFNPGKCEFLRITNKQSRILFSIYYPEYVNQGGYSSQAFRRNP